MKLQSIFDQTDFVHASGTKEELQVANYLKEQCETLGVPAELESFRVAMGEIEEAHLYADGMGIPCKALTCCGSGSVEGELYYMPGTDPVSVAGAKDKIVLMDTQGIGFFAYQDLMKAGAKAILFQYGNSYYPHTDIDQRDLREAVVGEEKKVLCAMIHSAQAVELVKNLEYDFSKADKDKAMNYGVIARTIVLDRMVEQYLKKHENTVVVNIACGLDTRCYRMNGKYLRWYNVDLPETMKIRSQFLTETDPVYQIAKSAMDDSYIDDIDYHGKNILVIIEGLTMYLYEKDIRKMFAIIGKSFQKATVMVETMSPFVVKHMKEKSIEGSNAKFTWGVKNGTELQRIVPGFSVQQEVSLVEGMKELMPVYCVIGKIPAVRNISNKIIVLEKCD